VTTPQEDEEPPFRGVELRLRVVDGACWIQVFRNGEEVFQGTEEPGFTRTFRSKTQLDVVLGAPNAVRATVNGELLDPPSDGGVYGASLVWEKGEVRVTPTL
jgi:hypothetical protein